MAVEPVGELRADLRVTTDKTPKDVRAGLEEVRVTGDKEMEKVGDDWSRTLDSKVKKGVKNTGRDVARSISDGIVHEGLNITKLVSEFDSDGKLARRWVTEEVKQSEKAVAELAASGAFKKVGRAFTDAVGSGFNVSGGSPLIAFLVPLFGFIAEAVAGAIQAVNGLVAVLTVVPNAIAAIILQAGTLYLAFKGVGTAIQGAFAAKNPDELKKALEGLTPAAQDFVTALLPLRNLFNQLRDIAQENFFDKLGASITKVADTLAPYLLNGIGGIANALGDLFRGLLNALSNPTFTRFLGELIPATTEWLTSLNSPLQDLIMGFADLGHAVMPFFTWLGQQLNGALGQFGVWLQNLSVDPDFLAWLDRMKETLSDLGDTIMSILKFVKEFVAALDRAGGNEALKSLTAQFNELAAFFASDMGTKAMEGLLHVIELLAYAFIFLVNGVLGLLFLFEITAEFIKNGLIPAIGGFFEWLGQHIIDLWNSFTNAVGNLILGIVHAIGDAFGWFITKLFEIGGSIAVWIHDRWNDITNFATSIPGRISDAVGDLKNTLVQAGRNVVQGLIDGIKSMFGSLGDAIGDVAGFIAAHFPHSPAKIGPLSGSGDPTIAGANIVKRLAAGIDMEAPTLANATNNAASNVLMGAGAVQMNFYGPTPTPNQASAVGGAAGNSLADALAQRNVQVAVRSIGAAA